MIGRKQQIQLLEKALCSNRSQFIAVTGRRRVGKTFLVDQVYKNNLCLRVTGIQDADFSSQIKNFKYKIIEQSGIPILGDVDNWQDLFVLLKMYLSTLPTDKKQVIFLDELPWIATAKSNFVQILAHLWNDYLSKQSHFILVICGSATSWITKNIVNDVGGLHNRLTMNIRLKPFNLKETRAFLEAKNIILTNNAIAELYMVMGGIPYYLENIERGESVMKIIERMCFNKGGILKNEYSNLYKAIFRNAENHEAIISALATSKGGLSRKEIILKSKVQEGGPYTRYMDDLLDSGFVREENPFGRKKRGSIYRLVDEYSLFYHKFIKKNKKKGSGIWSTLNNGQTYRIWLGYAFENLCINHLDEIKDVIGIRGVYTEDSSLVVQGNNKEKGFQIDLIIDRKDDVINLCECKYLNDSFIVDKTYATVLRKRKASFVEYTKTRKSVMTTMITNYPLTQNAHSLDIVDEQIHLDQLMD